MFANYYCRYPSYEILGDVSIAKGAAVATRYTDSSLRGILVDIHMLAHSDYLVCTFSSQVRRRFRQFGKVKKKSLRSKVVRPVTRNSNFENYWGNFENLLGNFENY